ncbi:MAG: SMP-30/gluconolactonase/LRE family protein [Bacteroidota bacterium]|nr:SMP-30/gluconolactonase/LRE family protein [Bacteroidota bacterium]
MENGHLFTPGTQPALISRQFSFTEGPAADGEGNIFFTDQPNDQIWKYDIAGKLSLFSDHTGRSNGLYIDPEGNIVACADEKGQLIAFSPDAKMHVLMEGANGMRLNGPNDLWINTDGGIYFTDPYYERNYWKDPKPVKHAQNVYYLPPGKTEPVIVANDLVKPNGIIGTADGKNLFVADIEGNKVFKYKIQPDGSITDKKLFTSMGSDGMTIDQNGDIYLTGKGVTIFDPNGKMITNIPINEDWTGNVCFGGKDKNQLFITASKGIYIMPMLVKGAR